jgi:SRSO17 transposase
VSSTPGTTAFTNKHFRLSSSDLCGRRWKFKRYDLRIRVTDCTDAREADRVEPFRGYCTVLLLPVKFKSVEPMAAQLAPTRVRLEHQPPASPRSRRAVIGSSRARCGAHSYAGANQPASRQTRGALIDYSGFPKKGRHSVGVARQYCAQLRTGQLPRVPFFGSTGAARLARGRQGL